MLLNPKKAGSPLEAESSIVSFAWSPRGDQIALALEYGIVRVIHVETNTVADEFRAPDLPTCLAWSNTGTLAVGMRNGHVSLRSYPSKTTTVLHPHARSVVQSLTWSKDGMALFSAPGGGGEGTGFRVVRTDGASGRSHSLDPSHAKSVNWLTVSPDGRLLASASDDEHVLVGGVDDWRPRSLRLAGYIRSVGWSPDSKRVVIGADKKVLEWRPDQEGVPKELFAGDRRIVCVSCSARLPDAPDSGDECLIAVHSQNRKVQILGPPSMGVIHTFEVSTNLIIGITVAFAPQDFRLAILSADKTIDIWDLASSFAPKHPAVHRREADHNSGPSAGRCPHEFDVAIICALQDPELDWVFKTRRHLHWKPLHPPGDPDHYYCSELPTVERRLVRVIATAANRPGMARAAVLTSKVITTFRPKLVFMVGIAAGTQANDRSRNAGDILVASDCFDYGAGKVVLRDEKRSKVKPHSDPETNSAIDVGCKERRLRA